MIQVYLNMLGCNIVAGTQLSWLQVKSLVSWKQNITQGKQLFSNSYHNRLQKTHLFYPSDDKISAL